MTLYNLVLEVIITQSMLKIEKTIFKSEHQCIAFINDVTIWAKTKNTKNVKNSKRNENI